MIPYLNARSVAAASFFEWRRLMKFPRLAWWLGLAAFPAVLTGAVRSVVGPPESVEEQAAVAFVLSGGVASVLALLLAATPVVYGELEGKTWAYLAVRPRGKGSVFAGKYLAAVTWATSAAWIGLIATFAVFGASAPPSLWLELCGIAVLGNLAVGAVMVFLGVLSLRRAMVFGVLYVLIAEIFLASVPAVVMKLTIRYRVQTLFAKATGLRSPPELQHFFGSGPAVQYVGELLLYSAALVLASLFVLHRRQLVTQQED